MTILSERPTFATNHQPSGRHGDLPYRSAGRLLSAGELRFYRQGLRPAFGERYVIAPKVRLTDVITVPDGQWDGLAGRKIRQRHVDFVLATKRSLRIAAVIELDDASHLEGQQQARDAYLADALQSAGILLVRFPIYRRYDARRIRLIVNRVVREGTSTATEP